MKINGKSAPNLHITQNWQAHGGTLPTYPILYYFNQTIIIITVDYMIDWLHNWLHDWLSHSFIHSFFYGGSSGVEICDMLRESKWILTNLLGENLCKNLCILVHSYSMYRTIFTRIYLDSRKISWARIFARIDSRILAEFLALELSKHHDCFVFVLLFCFSLVFSFLVQLVVIW